MSRSEAFAKHKSRPFQDEAYRRFIENSRLYIWSVNDGVKLFVRPVINADNAHSEEKWPRAWVGGRSEIVNCAVWAESEEGGYKLVAVWVFSEKRDGTDSYMLDQYKENIWVIARLNDMGKYGPAGKNKLVAEDCYDAFSCSGGDYVVSEFHCAALDNADPVSF